MIPSESILDSTSRCPGAWGAQAEPLNSSESSNRSYEYVLHVCMRAQLWRCPKGEVSARTVLNALLSHVLSLDSLYAVSCPLMSTVNGLFDGFWAVWMGAPVVTAAAVLDDLRSWRGAPVAAVPALQAPFKQQTVALSTILW